MSYTRPLSDVPSHTIGGSGCSSAPTNAAGRLLTHLWDSFQWSDVKIINGNHEYLLHKAIICPQSGFFKLCMSIDMKEKKEGVIELHEESDVARCMLRSLYTGDYGYPSDTCWLTFDAKIYCLALKYEIPGLQDVALLHFKDNSKDLMERLDMRPQTADFFKAVEILYEGTVQDDDPFRALLADVACQRQNLLESLREYKWMMSWLGGVSDHQELVMDLMYPPSGEPYILSPRCLRSWQSWQFSMDHIESVMIHANVSKKRAIIALYATHGDERMAIEMLQGEQ